MKSIMISIKPEWVAKILNGEKILEIRKSMPKCELPCKVYIYETKGKILIGEHFERSKSKENLYFGGKAKYITKKDYYFGKGKIVAEFTLNKIDLLIDCGFGIHYVDTNYNDLDLDYLTINSCLTDEKIYLYLGLRKNSGYYNDGYAWHIDDLKIYDKPKNLNKFSTILHRMKGKESRFTSHLLQRPPQSWCYVEEERK